MKRFARKKSMVWGEAYRRISPKTLLSASYRVLYCFTSGSATRGKSTRGWRGRVPTERTSTLGTTETKKTPLRGKKLELWQGQHVPVDFRLHRREVAKYLQQQ